jgi:hypothetical protein
MRNFRLSPTLFFVLFVMLTSCEEILFVEDISEKEVTLTAPANNAILFNTGITFSWEHLKNAEKYSLQIAKPNFTTPLEIVLDTIVDNNSFSHQLNIGQYEWRVYGLNSAYKTAPKSQTFEILNNDDFQDNTIVLMTPSHNLVTKNTDQKLAWQPVIGATEYQLQILDEEDAIVHDETTTTTSLDVAFPDGAFKWKIRASNGSKNTLYATRSLLVDSKSPNIAELTTPENSSTGTDPNILFQFNRTPLAGSAEKDSIFVYSNNALTILQFKDQIVSPYTKNLSSGTYHWYIQSFDQSGNQSDRSSVFSFTLN